MKVWFEPFKACTHFSAQSAIAEGIWLRRAKLRLVWLVAQGAKGDKRA